MLKKKRGLANGRGENLGFLKGGTRVNRDLLNNKVNKSALGLEVLTIESLTLEALNLEG